MFASCSSLSIRRNGEIPAIVLFVKELANDGDELATMAADGIR